MNLSLQAYPFFQKNSNKPIDRWKGGGGVGDLTLAGSQLMSLVAYLAGAKQVAWSIKK